MEYTLREGRQSYTPQYLISGFRYAKLENWPEEVRAENFCAHALYAGVTYGGVFECSNPLINRLVENVRWSINSNFVEIPTDCPTRERSGWTGDISVFGETACYLADPRVFLKKWLHDYMLEQSDDGNLPYIAPDAGKNPRARGCMGWSDGIISLAMTLYRFYGERALLQEIYNCGKQFIEFCKARAAKRNKYLWFKTGAHRKYIIETGFHYGEWLEPGTAMYKDFIKALFVPDTEVTTAQFYDSTCLMQDMAVILGNESDAAMFGALAQEIKAAYQKEFPTEKALNSKRQCRIVRPVITGIASESEARTLMAELNRRIVESGYRIGTGFLTTWRVLDMLTQHGYAETAYGMLENTQQPGWLFAVTKGATTVWENWFGLDAAGKPVDSHNHYAPGAAVAWLFSTCAGIRPEQPGFSEIRIQPVPGGSLSWAKAEYKSAQGVVKSAWRLEDREFQLNVELPDVPAVVVMPDGSEHRVLGGCHTFSCAL